MTPLKNKNEASMDYLLATKNSKKRDELQRILSPLGIRVILDNEAGLVLDDVEETGVTFEENALLKAQSACLQSGLPCIADDSGLCVDALNGAPGVYSARYAGEHGNDEENNKKLLSELKTLSYEDRTARFVCAACCVYPDGKVLTARGECEGHIGFSPAGNGGFGYDPVFIPETYDKPEERLTMAQLDGGIKDALSHRGKALRALAQKIGGKK
jgi:XTP/dITP diphosphohydrolase